MKFLADMGISPQSAAYLRRLGHDVIHLADQGLHKAADPEVIQKARSEERIILTHDLDFGALMASSGASLPSVIIFRLADMRPARVNIHLEHILEVYQSFLTEGVIMSVSEGTVRTRKLPIR